MCKSIRVYPIEGFVVVGTNLRRFTFVGESLIIDFWDVAVGVDVFMQVFGYIACLSGIACFFRLAWRSIV